MEAEIYKFCLLLNVIGFSWFLVLIITAAYIPDVSTWKNNLLFSILAFLGITIPCNCLLIQLPEYYDSSNIGRLLGSWFGNSIVLGCTFLMVAFASLIGVIVTSSKSKTMQKEISRRIDEQDKIFALSELESGNVDKLTWAKSLIAADGDETKAKAEYLKIRQKPAEPGK